MKTRNVLKALAVALLLPTSIFSQFQISGKVLDEQGKVIQGVTIAVVGENKGAVSQENGFYQIEHLPKGDYLLRTSLFGYQEEEKEVQLTEDLILNFTLREEVSILEGVDVKGVRASKKTPTTYSNISSEDIKKQNYGQDLPFLLSMIPSVVVTSDAGAGIGYTGYRIRGVDPTRTNVTVNGIPLNDAESQGVFWVNMPDFSSSVESMQVQRGVGTSSNGSGAFGASINVSTQEVHQKPYAVLDNSGGSFNSLRNSVKIGTGLLKNKFSVDARLSRIQSDGYIDRASSNLQSFYLAGSYHGQKSKITANVFGGKERTYQAWYGTPESRIQNDVAGMIAYAGRNGLSGEELENLLNSGRTYNAYTYQDETDNYQQTHYQLHYAYEFNAQCNVSLAGHYTRGLGYYENFRPNDKLATYGMEPVIVGEDTLTRMDLVRRKWLDNHFGGVVFNVNYKNTKGWDVILGGALNKYDGDHYGTVPWGEYMPSNDKDFQYYLNHSTKYDGNVYLKVNYQWKKWNFFGDAQYRHVDYSFLGIDDYGGKIIDVQHRVFYNFFNPKAGLSYQLNRHHSFYASYAIANKEPVRDDFKETTSANRPKQETLYNLEAGYRLMYEKTFLNANIFHMDYDNQLILTGEINDVGGYTRTNVKKSYRLGLELEGGYQIIKQLGLAANLSWSQNKINNFVEYVDSYDAGWNPIAQTKIEYGTTDMAFSPNFIAGLSLVYSPIEDLNISLLNKYVGAQYLDNTSDETRAISAYYLTHFDVSYTFSIWKLERITIGARINNVWDYKYENNGYTFSYLVGDERVQENFYYPQAGRNFMLRLMIEL